MSKQNGIKRSYALEKNVRSSSNNTCTTHKEKHKQSSTTTTNTTTTIHQYDSSSPISKHMKKVYPIGSRLYKTCSSLSLSSLSLSLSQNSNDSSLTTDSYTPLDQKIALALGLISSSSNSNSNSFHRNNNNIHHHHHQYSHPKNSNCNNQFGKPNSPSSSPNSSSSSSISNPTEEPTRRCYWITKNSDKLYVQFHDECWGVPVYDDHQLFELLALSGMLMDFNWTEILRRKQLFREAFCGFDPNKVAKMGDKEISELASDKGLMLAESKITCIVENAKCILKIAKEYGSFSNYMWNYVNYKPIINKLRQPAGKVPLRSPKAEIISKDLIKRGLRYVGPVIVYSFMQAAGFTIDHLVDCFRYSQCVNLAERPWRHV